MCNNQGSEMCEDPKQKADSQLWRPRFLITVISINDRISRVKPTDNGQT
jgi:hypothetical protein